MKIYHCSNTLFETIELDKRIWTETTHPASGIGLFFDVRKADYLTGFGTILYEIILKNELRILSWDVREFRDICYSFLTWEDAQTYGVKLSNNFDIIRIEETNGEKYQGIILNQKCVLSCNVLDKNNEFLK